MILSILLVPCKGITQTQCPTPIHIEPNNEASIFVDTNQNLRKVWPSFFGFNVDLTSFESDFWDNDLQKVKPELLEWLRAFPNAVYRYPGGTSSNYLNWSSSVGPRNKRTPQKLVDYRAAKAVNFGFDEYMSFVKNVGGSAWVIVNLKGDFEKESTKEEIGSSAGQWASYATNKYGAQAILRWELGNELYIEKWAPQKYADRANKAITEMSKSIGKDHVFVAMLEDYKKEPYYPGLLSSQYNSTIAEKIDPYVSEFALHEYFDSVAFKAKVFEDSVQHRLNYICQTINDIKNARSTANVGLWVTEFARWPPYANGQPWNTQWWLSSTLGAGIGVADFMIGAVQLPEVKGAFIHTLASNTGPWALFHTNKQNQLYPSVIYWTLRMFREHMQDYVLSTKTYSPDTSGYGGGYDIRSVALTDASRTKIALWVINRSNIDKKVKLVIPSLSGKLLKGSQTYMTDSDINATDRDNKDRLLPVTRQKEIRLNTQGNGIIEIPRNSAGVLEFSVLK
jgi:alpha-L-arabinofuranosidase